MSTKITCSKDDIVWVQNKSTDGLQFFVKQIERKLEKTQGIAKEIYNTVIKEMPNAAYISEIMKRDFKYVLDISDELKEQIEEGVVKLVTKNNGEVVAQIRNADGQFGSKIPIKTEQVMNMNPADIANALQLQSIQEQIETISLQLNVIDISVKDVIIGQQNDRLAGCESGKNLYLEALNVRDKQLQMALKVAALQSLSDANYQLRLTMQSDIAFLKNKEYKIAKGKQIEQIDNRMRSINQSFEAIHNASLMRAGIYCNEEEYDAMNGVLSDYSLFIEKTVRENANLLSQWDKRDDGTIDGIWKSRANLHLNRVIEQKIDSEQVFYIGVTKGEDLNENA